ncbi:MAG: FliI/YscN family ATPase, partial [Pseudomonadota bacterium]
DGLLTCGLGQRVGIFGEPGGGKSTLLASLVKGCEADVCVVALIGERGREVREFVEDTLGPDALARSVLVVATSDRPAVERASAAFTATAVAEHFRDQGKNVLLVLDSITRFARALRDIGLSAGELPTRRGFPSSVFAQLPGLLERAGTAATGSITAFYTVLVEGDGAGDPVAEEVRGILDGHIVLSADLAAKAHYPAIDIARSKSRLMAAVAEDGHRKIAARFLALAAKFREVEFLVQVDEYATGSDALADAAIERAAAMDRFLKQGADERVGFDATKAALAEAVA